MRARSGKTVLRRRARLRKQAKGYFLGRGNLYRQMRTTVTRAGAFAYRDRRQRSGSSASSVDDAYQCRRPYAWHLVQSVHCRPDPCRGRA